MTATLHSGNAKGALFQSKKPAAIAGIKSELLVR
jgi:hypothetical protein